jgi:glycosyltransferase involved in cell wall biosynthesis
MTDTGRPVLVAASNVGGGIARHIELARKVVDIDLLELPETLSLPAKIAKVRNRLRDTRPGLIVTHGVAAGVAARLRPRRQHGYRHVEIWHGDPFFLTPARRIPHHVLARMGFAPELQVFVNPALIDIYGDKRSKVIVLPNSVPLGQHQTSPSDPVRRVVYLGRLSPEKGYEDLLAAWPPDAQERGWRLDVFGEGQLVGVPVPPGVHVRGVTAQPLTEVATADVVVVPSWTEASPYVALEALSVGTPLIATRTGDIPDLMASGCGWLVEPRDVSSMRTALLEAQNSSRSELVALGELGRDWLGAQRPYDEWISAIVGLYGAGDAPVT